MCTKLACERASEPLNVDAPPLIYSLPKEGPANLSQLKCKKRFKRKKIQMLSNEIYTFWKLSIKW